MIKREVISVFDSIEIYGHDEDFTPKKRPNPCPHPPGSIGRLLELTRRVEAGEVLSIPEDNHIAASPEEQRVCGQYCVQHGKLNRDNSPLKGTRTFSNQHGTVKFGNLG
mgnify:CR=1 FL=1